MHTVKITSKHITELERIYAEIDEATAKADEAFKAARQFKGNLVRLTRKNGQEVELTEGELWEELRFIGAQSEGLEIMKEKYPQVFALAEAQQAKAQELAVYCKRELELDPVKLRLIDILHLVRAMQK